VTAPTRPARTPAPDKLAASLTRYRVMAWVTGGFLLLLTFEMVVKYGFNSGEPFLGTWIAIVHGWIYVVYLITVVDMWSKLRWGPGRLITLVLAGVIPVLSFVVERKVTVEARERIASLSGA
jgi:integral membrane protein